MDIKRLTREQLIFLAGNVCGAIRAATDREDWLPAFREVGTNYFTAADEADVMAELDIFIKEFLDESNGTGDDVSGDGVSPDWSANANCV